MEKSYWDNLFCQLCLQKSDHLLFPCKFCNKLICLKCTLYHIYYVNPNDNDDYIEEKWCRSCSSIFSNLS